MKNDRLSINQAKLCIIGTALGYSLMGVTLKLIPFHPLVLNGMEKAFCFVLLGLSRKSFHIRFNRSTLPGAVFMYFSAMLFMVANKMTTAANAVILQYTNPIFVILFSYLFLHKKAEKRDMVFTAVMLFGMCLFFVDDISIGNMAGNLVAILSGVAMALANMYAHYSGADVQEYGMINCLIAMAVAAVAVLFYPPEVTVASAAAVVFYGIFCSAIPIILLAKGAPYVEPLNISMLLMIEPVCGPIWVALVVKEIPGRLALAGAGIVILSLFANMLYPAFRVKKCQRQADI